MTEARKMDHSIISNGGRALPVADTHVVALYDPKTGRIAHVHTVTVFEGGRAVTEAEAVEKAKTYAIKLGHSIEHLQSKVAKDLTFGRKPHRIDIASGRFVALPTKSHKRK